MNNSLLNEEKMDYKLMEKEEDVISIISFNNDIEVIGQECPKYFKWLDRYFKIYENGSTIKTELYAGVVNFLAMSYILACNPTILSQSGIPIHNASSATCLATFLATMVAGLIGNVPIGCAPGVGLSAYFSYSVMAEIKDDYNLGLFMIFCSGVVVLVLTLLKITPLILERLPVFMKLATIVGMGLFLSLVGLSSANIIVSPSDGSANILALGDLGDWKIWLFFLNLFMITILEMNHIRGSMMISILTTALLYFVISENWLTHFIAIPSFNNITEVINHDNLMKLVHLPITTIVSVLSSFMLVMILDVGGVIFAITKMGDLPESKSRTKWALISTSFGTIVASLLGCSPIIVHIESVAGILVGGRTGLTAVTTATLFGLSIILSPIFNSLPNCSTAAITVFIGTLMMQQCKEIEWEKYEIALPAFLTIIMMPFTFSISYGIFFGLGSYFVLMIFVKLKEYLLKKSIPVEEVKFEGVTILSSSSSSHSDMSISSG